MLVLFLHISINFNHKDIKLTGTLGMFPISLMGLLFVTVFETLTEAV